MLGETQKQLIIIGGAEDKQGDCEILWKFVQRSGGTESRIVVMTVATRYPKEVGEKYTKIFQRLGSQDVQVVDTAVREDAYATNALEAIERATGVFFTGGNQTRITDLLKDTELEAVLHQRFSQGLVVAGTSAGAAMIPDVMIANGEGETNPRMDVVKLERGMGFLPGVALNQHFAQGGRLARLVSALVQQPAVLGFGIDENTAIAIRGNELDVIGKGAVTVVDVANISHSNIDALLPDEPRALCGVKLHILPHGYRFDLARRLPIG